MKKKATSKAADPVDALRHRIDALDADLVRLLNQRTEIVLEIGEIKKKLGKEIYVPSREKTVFDRVTKLNQGPLPGDSIRAIYREVMSAALSLECGLKIAYLGPTATFTHQASRLRFGASVEYVAVETIGDVFTAVQKRTADYGVVPIENSTDGAVTHTFDEFVETSLKICAEIYLPISHNLMAVGKKSDIKKIYSKPEVFGQCRRWLNSTMPGVELIPVSSTAKGAEMSSQDPKTGALASNLAADLYNLKVLAHDVQDMAGNTTRFLVIGKSCGGPTGNDKTSLCFTVKDRVGALHDVLASFKRGGINMSKIESRPSRQRAWDYIFFVDIDGHAEEPHVKKALRSLHDHCARMSVLGSYPKALETA